MLEKEPKVHDAIKFGKGYYAFQAWRKNGDKTILATHGWLKMRRMFVLLEIVDAKPDVEVVVINEDQKIRPQQVASVKHKCQHVTHAPQETGVVILSALIKCWPDDIFYCHNVEFMQLGQYVMRFTLVAPAAAVGRMLRGEKKGSWGKCVNSNSLDPETIAQLLQTRNMEPISRPFDYAVNLLREKLELVEVNAPTLSKTQSDTVSEAFLGIGDHTSLVFTQTLMHELYSIFHKCCGSALDRPRPCPVNF
jgi:hypothetical protein